MIMFTNGRRPIFEISALKWVMRQKRNFLDSVARFPLTNLQRLVLHRAYPCGLENPLVAQFSNIIHDS